MLFREGEDKPVTGQLNIVDAIPGDEGYSDFWQIVPVTVPKGYVANTVTSLRADPRSGVRDAADQQARELPDRAGRVDRAPARGGESPDLHRGWYRGQVVFYFTFEEKSLSTTRQGMVPVSPIYVTFKVNPDQPGGGPASGFVTERGGVQTHNVVQTIPSDQTYSPLWLVNVYDNTAFPNVHSLQDLGRARILANAVATVNCPIVEVGS